MTSNKFPQTEYQPLVGFQSRKAAQVCAFFASKIASGIEKLKLIKLVYLSERSFLSKYACPMLYDELFSLEHGPVCSSTLNGINGFIDNSLWSDFINTTGNLIKSKRVFTRDDLDEISDAEIDILSATWESVGWMTPAQIRSYAHKHCPEYTETKGRIPIAYRDVFEALGIEEAAALEQDIACFRKEKALLGI